MNLKSYAIPLVALSGLISPLYAAKPQLPKVEILGKEYYYYDVDKDETIYGVSRKFDWNLEELVRLNPNATTEWKKGTRLYYPTGRVTVVSEVEEQTLPADTVYAPIRHRVKKGETVYSIARMYNVSLDKIYADNPNSKHGIKTGQELVINQTPDTPGGFLYYEVKPGDTLYSLSKQYHSSVEDILKSNPGISESRFRIGDTLRIPVNSDAKRYHTELVEEERLAGIDSYKVKKNDTWRSISKKTGVEEAKLKEANENVAELKKNEIIAVPVIETVEVEKEFKDEDSRELTPEGIQEMYDSIHRVDSEIDLLREVKVALLLDEPTSKKDIDFTRGFMVALDKMKDSPYKVALKVVDGRGSSESVTDELDDFAPNIVIATADKAFPAFLADYGATNHLEVVNVFDVKNELYEDNPSMIQILPPSSLFNEQVAEWMADEYKDYELLMTGIADENDAIAEILLEQFPENKVKHLSVNSLAEYDITDTGRYLVYAYPQKRDDINEILATVKNIREEYPVADITVVGRPSWVTVTDTFEEKFNTSDVIVPARCWLDPESDNVKGFYDEFEQMFDQTPVKSFPNFAANGYDIANYFIEATAKNGGDFNKAVTVMKNGIQTDFNLKRVSNWGGFLNPPVYILKFRPSGMVDKIELK